MRWLGLCIMKSGLNGQSVSNLRLRIELSNGRSSYIHILSFTYDQYHTITEVQRLKVPSCKSSQWPVPLICYTNLTISLHSPQKMPWKETSPGRFERPFDGLEVWYRALASGGAPLNREHWSITTVAKIRLRLPAGETVAALRHAWKTIRYDNPQIACTEQGGMNVYEVPDETAVTAWLNKTFIVAPPSSSQTASGLFSNFAPSPCATFYYLPQTSEVAIHCSHSRMDGVGALHLLHQLFTALAEPRSIAFGTESKNLSPGLDDATGTPSGVTPEIEQAVAEMLTEYTSNLPSLGLPTNESNQIPGPTQRRELDVGTARTAAIVTACKDCGISVTAAVHAALIAATRQLAPPELATKKYTSWCAIDLRPYCQPPYDSAAHPVTLYHAGLVAVIAPSSFLTDASELQSIYKRSWRPSQSNLLTLVNHLAQNTTDLLSQPTPADMPSPSEPGLSGLGVVDRYIQSKYGDMVEVNDFWLAVEMLSRQVQVHLWTFQSKLRLSACFNEMFYEGEFVESFLSKIQDVLIKELKIEKC